VKLVIVHGALADLQKAVNFYTAQSSPKLGLTFLAEFERVTNLITLSPHLGAVIRGTRRQYSLRQFPYNVIYQITLDELRVIALAHQRRRPAYWAKRK
jgi:toxin ParE1/3/4